MVRRAEAIEHPGEHSRGLLLELGQLRGDVGLGSGFLGCGLGDLDLCDRLWFGLDSRLGLSAATEEASKEPRTWLGLDDLRLRLGFDDDLDRLGSGSDTGSTIARLAESVTRVPQPEGLISTLPLVCAPSAASASQSTARSGSVRTMRISPSSPRWRASVAGSLSSAHSSGGDLTRVRCTSEETLIAHVVRAGSRDSCSIGFTNVARTGETALGGGWHRHRRRKRPATGSGRRLFPTI